MDIFYEMIINWKKLNVSQLQHNDFNQVAVHRRQRLHWKKKLDPADMKLLGCTCILPRSSALIC